MAVTVVSTFARRRRINMINIGVYGALVLLLLGHFSQGSGAETEAVSSSQGNQRESNEISVRVSESIRDTKTVDKGVADHVTATVDATKNDIVVTPTRLPSVINKSSISSKDGVTSLRIGEVSEDRWTDANDILTSDAVTKHTGEYYVIKPTETLKPDAREISRTHATFPGEAEGVSTKASRPQGHPDADKMNYKAETSRKFYGDASAKYLDKYRLGKNYNQLEKTLGKIAKIALDDNGKNVTATEDSVGSSNRKSRDEENRKASPDIQDIITGIVKILNGKATGGHPEPSAAGRPQRPTSTRINNRGPPRISDVPPLDFDAPPPSFVPLPPPPPKRPPPPYPFDVPPSMPDIPLPPQPLKPGHSSLPSHPFIDGVPIPELVVPGDRKPPNRPVASDYDTISVSVPQPGVDNKFPPLTVKPLPENATRPNTIPLHHEATKNATMKPIEKQPPKAATTTPASVPSKNGNKRVRPRPPGLRPRPFNNSTRLPPKPIRMKNTTLVLGASPSPSPETVESTAVNVTTEETIFKEEEQETVTEDQVATLTEDSPPPTLEPSVSVGDRTESTLVATPSAMPGTEEVSGVGEATPVLESSEVAAPSVEEEVKASSTPALSASRPTFPTVETTHEYKVRPGIVLDDPEYKPGMHKHPLVASPKPIITAPPPPHRGGHYGEIFDITVHAVQGPGGNGEATSGKPFVYPVELDGGVIVQNPQAPIGDVAVITKPEEGQDFVSIDGKRTYINLFGESTAKPEPTATKPPHVAPTGYPVPHKERPQPPQQSQASPGPELQSQAPKRGGVSAAPPRRPYKRPTHPPVRIDTCIVGDDSTCDSAQNEMCRTEDGVSSCHCRPGYNRRKHRDTCRRVVSMSTSLRVDKLYDRRVRWQDTLSDPDSEEYQQLSYEASQAIESAMSMTPFSDDFINSRINSIYTAKNLETNEPAVYINVTLHLEENLDTVRPAVKHDIQRHLLRVIQRRNNNVGNSAIWVESPPGSILALRDVDECTSSELHDCHPRATCSNTFGSFECRCPEGSRDPWLGNIHRQGRHCETCSPEFCNNRGECRFEQGRQTCHCTGSFYGAQCEVDGEVLGVAVGASVAAAIIIILTLVCLCMWSRKWSREQKSAVGAGSPVFGYVATAPTVKTPNVGGPPYQVSIEDRIRWAQIADVMAQANHYAQPEPGNGGTRTSFGGYPTLPAHAISTDATLPLSTVTPPVPLPRLSLPNKPPSIATYGAFGAPGSMHRRPATAVRSSLDTTTSSSEEEDRADLLGRHFNAPRPKSRTSVANQSGIYYDVDYDRSDIYSKQNTIPMNTYTLNPQHQVRSFFSHESSVMVISVEGSLRGLVTV